MYYTWIKSKEADQKKAGSGSGGERVRDEDVEEGLLMRERSPEEGSSKVLFEIAEESDEEGGRRGEEK